MAQRITTSFLNTNRPGAYFDVQVKSTPTGVASSGNIVIIGEAAGGAALQGIDSANGDLLSNNFFTPDQVDRVVAKYISGPIVDAFRAISSPSSDAGITGSANLIYIAKTNVGTQAQATVEDAYGTLRDKNWGVNGNKYSFSISQSVDEVAPEITGSVIAAFGVALNGTFAIRVDGGAEATVTIAGSPADMATLLAELNGGALPAGITASEGTAPDSLTLTYDADAAANTKGSGKSIELIEDSGLLAALGHSEGLVVSSAEPEVQLDIVRQDTGINESFLAEAQVALNIGYAGTTAIIDIDDETLETTVTGGSGANLSINLSEYPLMSDLADFINSQTGYTCVVSPEASQLSPVSLDNVTAVGIASTDAGLLPGRIKVAAERFRRAAAQSAVLDFIPTKTLGLPEVAGSKFLTGGQRGGTLAADFVTAFTDLEGIDTNFVIPLISRDASADILDGQTDSSSTYTIAAINALAKSHVLKMSTAKIKKHRVALCSFDGPYLDAVAQSGSLANQRVSLCMQRTSQVNAAGQVVNFQPWHTACIAAGMQAAGFYRSITNKFANVISFSDPTGFDSGSPGDIESAIDAGLLFLERAVVGSKWVVDQTTYGIDTNFVYNSLQAMYAADLVSLDLADSFQTAFVGQSLADVDASTALSFLASKMDTYKKQKLIAASSDAPLGFKNARVRISGPIMEVGVEIKLATAILFIPINIEISQVQSEA